MESDMHIVDMMGGQSGIRSEHHPSWLFNAASTETGAPNFDTQYPT
jgi:hypothetical protein